MPVKGLTLMHNAAANGSECASCTIHEHAAGWGQCESVAIKGLIYDQKD